MAGELTDPRIEVPLFYATDGGIAYLDRNPILFHAVADFCRTEERPEQRLRHYSTTGVPLRVSNDTESWEVGSTEDLRGSIALTDLPYISWAANIEIEVSTGTTGTSERVPPQNDDLAPMRKRSLLHQFFYMDAIRNLLALRREFSVFVPEQLFVLETPNGDSLVAQKSLAPLDTLETYLIRNRIGEEEAAQLIRDTVQAVEGKLGGSDLAYGVSDLGRSGEVTPYASNIHISPYLKAGEFAPSSLGVFINRQPTPGARGMVGVIAAYRHLNGHGRKYHREPPNP